MRTKEELLKIYSAYLPYELTAETVLKTKFIFKGLSFRNFLQDEKGYGMSSMGMAKLHLYSMDMLTKEIEHKGERFIPLHKILEEYCFDLSKMDNEEILSYAESLIKIDMTVTTYNLLLEWHFNVFGLEENEYIKKTLAKN